MKNYFTILLSLFLSLQFINSQEVTTHEYRHVPTENMDEYLKRETTYWSKLAEREIKKGNLTYWAILQKVGGENIPNTPNVLTINSYTNMDERENMWGGISQLFPNVKLEDMATEDLCTRTDIIYLRKINGVEVENADPDKDFRYVHLIYHNTINVGKHFEFENTTWAPLLKKAMDKGITTMRGWENYIVVSPVANEFPYSSASYDFYSTIHHALSETFSDNMEFGEGFFDNLNANYAGPKNSHLYRIVKVVRAADEVREIEDIEEVEEQEENIEE
jgi:hypothetical protein